MNTAWMLLTALALPLCVKPIEAKGSRYASEGDGFHLRAESFESNQSYVYTAKAHFESGQACGLLFGAKEEQSSFVFNVDRKENRTKLLSFETQNGQVKATELFSERFIGNETMLQGEEAMVLPPLSNLPDFYFKVVITSEGDKVYGEFFLDNIKRFGVDNKIELTSLGYQGGYLGFNTFASDVSFEDVTIGKSAYSYYSEPYRNQYHYSQFAHWNNDPNGLVYYQGYYHLYYQMNPYGKTWGDMYWGHARSKDLLHWQELPIALYPDDGTIGFGSGRGYAWSGSAFVYRKGMSPSVDAKNWFPNGKGSGLLFAYTRDGSSSQDQILVSSDDGGMSFTRRVFLPQSLYQDGAKVDCRDPKIISLGEQDFLMLVSSQAHNRVIFFRSSDLLSWRPAGGFNYPRPECVDVLDVTADNGTKKKVLTFMGREYIVGDFLVSGDSVRFLNQEGQDLSTLEMAHGVTMDYARDRYATQSFVIDDESSPYYGKPVSVSWWSGVPGEEEAIESGSLAAFRSSWNGGGQTIPTIEGLHYEKGRYVLTETPVTYQNEALKKKRVVQGDFSLDSTSSNPLSQVASSSLELNASLQLSKGTSLEFRVSESETEWIGIGYSPARGYYVDRTHSNQEASTLRAYNRIYQTGKEEGREEVEFKILVDHGGVEVFADSGRYPFYVLSVASPTSFLASVHVEGSAQGKIEANEIESTFASPNQTEGMLYVHELEAHLDMNLTTSQTILVYDSANSPITYSILSGEDVISITPVREGVKIDAISPGNASIEISTPTSKKVVDVTVYGRMEEPGEWTFQSSGIHSGRWNETPNGIEGNCQTGDGYLLSENEASDFNCSLSFSLEATAAGLVFRASKDFSDYVVANVDHGAKVTKLFSKRSGVIAEASLEGMLLSHPTLSVEASGNQVKVSVNGSEKINATLPEGEKASGYLGLNVFSGKATFSSPRLLPSSYSYEGGTLSVSLPENGPVLRLVNLTLKNSEVSQELYSTQGKTLLIEEEAFAPLSPHSVYRFKAETPFGALPFSVEILDYHYELKLEDIALDEGLSYRVKLYGQEVSSVSVNGKDCLYRIEKDILIVPSSSFKVGENEILVNQTLKATVLVYGKPSPSKPMLLSRLLAGDSSSNAAIAFLGLALSSLLFASWRHSYRKD